MNKDIISETAVRLGKIARSEEYKCIRWLSHLEYEIIDPERLNPEDARNGISDSLNSKVT